MVHGLVLLPRAAPNLLPACSKPPPVFAGRFFGVVGLVVWCSECGKANFTMLFVRCIHGYLRLLRLTMIVTWMEAEKSWKSGYPTGSPIAPHHALAYRRLFEDDCQPLKAVRAGKQTLLRAPFSTPLSTVRPMRRWGLAKLLHPWFIFECRGFAPVSLAGQSTGSAPRLFSMWNLRLVRCSSSGLHIALIAVDIGNCCMRPDMMQNMIFCSVSIEVVRQNFCPA